MGKSEARGAYRGGAYIKKACTRMRHWFMSLVIFIFRAGRSTKYENTALEVIAFYDIGYRKYKYIFDGLIKVCFA